jgi:hypothetical protein
MVAPAAIAAKAAELMQMLLLILIDLHHPALPF